MGKYTGSKCFSCGKVFTDNDDVVVCADCGTPYHRACYEKEGKCINEQLHETGQSWQEDEADFSSENEERENIRCIRCGYENTPEKLFCEKCGTPLMKNPAQDVPFNTADGRTGSADGEQNGQQNDFMGFGGQMGAQPQMGRVMFDQNSDIDGVKLGDYAKYVGPNPLGMLSNFIRFGKFGKKASLNFAAFLFPEVYFLYRKMKPWGIIALLLFSILSIPTMIYGLGSGVYGMKLDMGINFKSQSFTVMYEAASYITLGLKVLAGMYANYLYYKQAKKDITDIRNDENVGGKTPEQAIAEKGGVSWINVIVGFTLYMVITMGATMLIKRLM